MPDAQGVEGTPGDVGAGDKGLRNIVQQEAKVFLAGGPEAPAPNLALELRRAFNPNGNPVWFKSMSSLLNQLSVLTIALTGAAMLREALLVIMVIIPVIMLSGGMGAVESQPDFVQKLTLALPSRHFLAFAKAVAFRGAGLSAVWPQLALMAGLGTAFFGASLAFFRRSMSVTG